MGSLLLTTGDIHCVELVHVDFDICHDTGGKSVVDSTVLSTGGFDVSFQILTKVNAKACKALDPFEALISKTLTVVICKTSQPNMICIHIMYFLFLYQNFRCRHRGRAIVYDQKIHFRQELAAAFLADKDFQLSISCLNMIPERSVSQPYSVSAA